MESRFCDRYSSFTFNNSVLMPFSTTITAALVPDITYKITCSDTIEVFYMNQKVYGAGLTGCFIASTSQQLVIESNTQFTIGCYHTGDFIFVISFSLRLL